MALEAKVGSFLWDAATTAGGTIVVSDVGFQPKAIIFFAGGRSEATDAVGAANRMDAIGFAVSATDRRCLGRWDQDAQATSRSGSVVRYAQCLATMSTNGTTATLRGALDVQSMDAGGFTLVVDTQIDASLRVGYLALGGASLTNVKGSSFNLPATTTGNLAVTGVGFQPDCLLFFMYEDVGSADDLEQTRGGFNIGMAVAVAQEAVVSTMIDGASQATMITWSYGRDVNDCLSMMSAAGSFRKRNVFVSMDADGFTINRLTAGSAARNPHYLALKGGNYAVGSLLTRTDGADIAVSGLGFKPSGVFFASAMLPESAAGTVDNADARVSMGAATSPTERVAVGAVSQDNVADSNVATAIEHDEVYVHVSTTDTVEALMDLKSMDAGGFTCVMDDVEVTASYVAYAAFGPAPAAAVPSKVVQVKQAVNRAAAY